MSRRLLALSVLLSDATEYLSPKGLLIHSVRALKLTDETILNPDQGNYLLPFDLDSGQLRSLPYQDGILSGAEVEVRQQHDFSRRCTPALGRFIAIGEHFFV